MILTCSSRRVLLAVCLPVLLMCIGGLFRTDSVYVWVPFLFTLTLVLCLWVDGLGGPQRPRYGKIGMMLSAPSLLLWLMMLTGNYLYQSPYCILEFEKGVIEVNTGSRAALASMRTPIYPPRHYAIGGNWSYQYTDGWRGAGKLALTSVRKLGFPPKGTMFGTTYITFVNGSGVQFDRHEIPVTAFLLVTGLPTLILLLGRGPKPKPGQCEICKYDLTGNTSGVCPECGTAVPIAASKGKMAASHTG